MPTIVAPLSPRMTGQAVADLHEALGRLGYSIAGAERGNLRYGASTRDAVSRFQAQFGLAVTGAVDAATAKAIDEALVAQQAGTALPSPPETPSDSPPATTFTVQGEVVKPDGMPLAGYIVRAYDRGLCEWRPLGGTAAGGRTDDLGRYEIAYDPAQLKQWGKRRADLKVEVFDRADGETPLAESPLILGARPVEVVNFSIGESRYRGPSEFTRVERALTPQLQSHGDDLACIEVADVLILARDAGMAASNVAIYVKARRWSTTYGVHAALFYALMRRGEPTQIDALLARPLSRLWEKLQQAHARNLIAVPLTDGARNQIAQLQREYLARPEHPYARLLASTNLTAAQRTAFTRALTGTERSADSFWTALSADDAFSSDAVLQLQRTFELQDLTGENTSLTVRLRTGLGVDAPRDSAAFSVEYWRDTVLADTAVEIPDEILPDGNMAQRRGAYAQMLYRAAEARYPTASLSGQMARAPTWSKSGAFAFLSDNPDFEFRDQRLFTYLRERPQTVSESSRTELLRVEQLFHLLPLQDKLARIQPLWDAQLRSAPQVAYLGRTALAQRVGKQLDTATVQEVYRKAIHITALALNVYLRFHPNLNRLSLAGLRMPQPPQDEVARAALSTPEWEALFGSADACQCSPCESALSPAAYLVDTMAFLQRAVDAGGRNALDELLARRPDLGTLRLTCENSETPLPHIDVVNEILEAIVASADGRTLAGADIGETTWPGEQLAAQPEHLEPAAYEILRTAMYPIEALPFDLWAEEGRRYLEQMGLAREALMRSMPRRAGVGALHIAVEALRMSGLEQALIGQPKTTAADIARRWGYDGPRALSAARLGSVEALLARAHVDYDRLLRLLNTRYVNPARAIGVRFGAVACSLDGAFLADTSGAPIADQALLGLLDRLHRFLRLQRRVGCSEYELDLLIRALGVADFDDRSFFPALADALALRDALHIDLPALSAWWAPLDTYLFEEGVDSQYESVYLDPALFPASHAGPGADLRNDVFALRSDRLDLVITTSSDASLSRWLAQSDGAVPPTYTLQAEYAAWIQSATRLGADDLMRLVERWLPKDAATSHVALDLANLSSLHRVASLVEALGIGVSDFLRLAALIGGDPLFTSTPTGGPTRTRAFHEAFLVLDLSAFSIETLAYLLLHDDEAASVLAPSQASIDAWLASTAAAFAGILALDDASLTIELKAALSQSLGSALQCDAAALDALLFRDRPELGDALLAHAIVAANPGANGLPVPAMELAALFMRLHKFALGWTGLGLDLAFQSFVLLRGPALGWMDLAAFPSETPADALFERWRRLSDAAQLQRTRFTAEQSLFALLEQAAAHSADPSNYVEADFLDQVAQFTGWPLADLTYLVGPDGFDLALPGALQDERPLVALARIFDLIRSKGIAAPQAHAWTVAELGYAEAQSLKQLLSVAYAPERWLEALGAIQNPLRSLKRDALLGHLLNRLGIQDADAFYQRYLIDPAEAPCGLTSRIVEAHAAVQLFVQRILLNLEPFAFSRADGEAWVWRKKYRVWEATRKIFLWPENWLEPEWRDNKSAFFVELEDALLQGEVTSERAEEVYLDFLHKIDSVAQLEIMGMYHDQDDARDVDTLHVFARTKGVSHQYYYRRQEDGSRWSPWEPVGLDINTEHLIPVVGDGRLYLFWPEFGQSDNPNSIIRTTTQVESDPERADAIRDEIVDHQSRIEEIDFALTLDSPNIKTDEGSLQTERAQHVAAIAALEDELNDLIVDKTSSVLGDRYLMEVGMKWSEYRNGRWTNEKVSSGKLTYTTSDKLSRHYFTGWVDVDGVLRISARINKYANGEGIDLANAPEGYLGFFYFDSYSGNLAVSEVEVTDPAGEVGVTNALPAYHAAAWYATWWSSDSLELQIGDPPKKRLLIESPGRLYYLHQHGQYGSESAPFFFTDDARTYFVQPVSSFGGDALLSDFVSTATRQPGKRGAQARAMAAPRATSPAALLHYGGTASDVVLDHSVASAASLASTTATVGSVIAVDRDPSVLLGSATLNTQRRYTFTRFYHPHTRRFLQQANRRGVDGLLSPDPAWDAESSALYRQLLPGESFDFADAYSPNTAWVTSNFQAEDLDEQIDFAHDGAYGSYNWELFFHAPMLIATRLMQNQRYADARRWLQHIFDPTGSDGTGPAGFWKIKPFFLAQQSAPEAELGTLLSGNGAVLEAQVEAWEGDPFNAHLIARMRTTAYMQATVMRFLDCLIGEADLLFQRDTREDINEARQLYVLAGQILGDPPTVLPPQDPPTLTPDLLLGRFRIDWNGFLGHGPLDPLTSILPTSLRGSAPVRSRTAMPSVSLTVDASLATVPLVSNGTSAQGGTTSLDTLLLFCVPYNETLYAYWAKVADRLFKIRNCMNLSGQVRQLALYAPPIDPALLLRASAAGLSIEAILNGMFAPRSHYRFAFLLQKAIELCADARNLGAAMLSALEKQDAESLANLRASQEVALLDSIRTIKTRAVDESEAALASLRLARESAVARRDYYAGLERISSGERKSLDKQDQSRVWQIASEGTEVLASALHIIPYTYTGTEGGLPSFEVAFGGPQLGAAAQATASGLRARASALVHQSSQTGTIASFERRFRDWQLQADLASREMAQLDKQIVAAEIRKQIADDDLLNHDQQSNDARAIQDVITAKFTNERLYGWTVSKLSSVYFQAYQMAEQMARQAEAAFQQELGPDETALTFVRPGNWDSLMRGLQAGELLQQQLRQMETAYVSANRRELEITKHVSLLQLDPQALLALRETGSCEFHVPEVLFDMDFPAHYFRRIRAVRLSLPCIAGPYTNVSATLRLVRSWTRRSADRAETTQPALDAVPAAQATIATSSGEQDSGVFELTFGDSRYLPFEGAGAVSSWRLELATAVRGVDYDSIADAVLHLSYTAREATDPVFRQSVNARIQASINTWASDLDSGGATLARLFSLRSEFSAEWNRLLYPASGAVAEAVLQLGKQQFPGCLAYLWEDADGDGLTETQREIVIRPTGVSVYLMPIGAVPSDVFSLTLNGRSASIDSRTGLPMFDAVAALGNITNLAPAELKLTLQQGELRPQEWRDLYVLLSYEIAT